VEDCKALKQITTSVAGEGLFILQIN